MANPSSQPPDRINWLSIYTATPVNREAVRRKFVATGAASRIVDTACRIMARAEENPHLPAEACAREAQKLEQALALGQRVTMSRGVPRNRARATEPQRIEALERKNAELLVELQRVRGERDAAWAREDALLDSRCGYSVDVDQATHAILAAARGRKGSGGAK